MFSAFHYSWKSTDFLCLCLLRIMCSKLRMGRFLPIPEFEEANLFSWVSLVSRSRTHSVVRPLSSLQKHLPPDGQGLPSPAAASARFLFGSLSIHLSYAEGRWVEFYNDHHLWSTCYAPVTCWVTCALGFIPLDLHSARCFPALITKEETEDLKPEQTPRLHRKWSGCDFCLWLLPTPVNKSWWGCRTTWEPRSWFMGVPLPLT